MHGDISKSILTRVREDRRAALASERQQQQIDEGQSDLTIISNNPAVPTTRKKIGFKAFASYKDDKAHIWWKKETNIGIRKITSNANASGVATTVTLHYFIGVRKSEVDIEKNQLVGDGQITSPYEHYINLGDTLQLKLVYSIIFPPSFQQLQALKEEENGWILYTFEIAKEQEEEQVVIEDVGVDNEFGFM